MATLDDEWKRFERHLELAGGFWLTFVFAESEIAGELLSRARKKMASFGRTVTVMSVRQPAGLADALTAILAKEARDTSCIWVNAVVEPNSEEWDKAWANFVLRANERRDAIRRNLESSSLVIAAPPIVKHYFQDGASDLWSVRALVLEPRFEETVSPGPLRSLWLPDALPPLAEPEDSPLVRLAEIAARADLPVLIAGPLLSGKRHVALFIHEHNKRKEHPVVVVEAKKVNQQNFFGYVRGAFLGAIQAEEGIFERANKGSLILLMIEELKPEGQEALVKVMDTGEVTRMGAMRPTKVDVRVIATTSADLEALCQQGLFRKDLYHRLSLMRIDVPAPPVEPQK